LLWLFSRFYTGVRATGGVRRRDLGSLETVQGASVKCWLREGRRRALQLPAVGGGGSSPKELPSTSSRRWILLPGAKDSSTRLPSSFAWLEGVTPRRSALSLPLGGAGSQSCESFNSVAWESCPPGPLRWQKNWASKAWTPGCLMTWRLKGREPHLGFSAWKMGCRLQRIGTK
jgi:hypothetical protein